MEMMIFLSEKIPRQNFMADEKSGMEIIFYRNFKTTTNMYIVYSNLQLNSSYALENDISKFRQ